MSRLYLMDCADAPADVTTTASNAHTGAQTLMHPDKHLMAGIPSGRIGGRKTGSGFLPLYQAANPASGQETHGGRKGPRSFTRRQRDRKLSGGCAGSTALPQPFTHFAQIRWKKMTDERAF